MKSTMNTLKRKNQEYKIDFSELRRIQGMLYRGQKGVGVELTKVKTLN
jgi:hypothetical protein